MIAQADRIVQTWKRHVRIATLEALSIDTPPRVPLVPEKAPVALSLEFWFPRPASHYRGGVVDDERGPGSLKPAAPLEYVSEPDVDNLAKLVMDAVGPWPKGQPPILWKNDAIVTTLTVSKRYAARAGVVIRLESKSPLILQV